MEFEKIKAFNRNASIGDLYDSRTMEIINVIDLFKSTDYKDFIESATTTTTTTATTLPQIHFINLENPKEKYKILEINPIIKLDLKTITGSSRLIFEEKKSKRSIMKLLFHSLNTNYEKIDLRDQNLNDYLLKHNILEEYENNATHIICGIQYGVNTIATFEYENFQNSNNKQQLQAALNSYLEEEDNSNNPIKNLKINFESDLIILDNKLPQNYKDIKDFLANIPIHLNDNNNNKGIPLEFTLFQIDKLTNKQVNELKLDQIENELFNLIEVKQELNDYVKDLNDNKKLFHSEFIQLINQKHERIESNENYLKIKLKPILDLIRRRSEESFKLD